MAKHEPHEGWNIIRDGANKDGRLTLYVNGELKGSVTYSRHEAMYVAHLIGDARRPRRYASIIDALAYVNLRSMGLGDIDGPVVAVDESDKRYWSPTDFGAQ